MISAQDLAQDYATVTFWLQTMPDSQWQQDAPRIAAAVPDGFLTENASRYGLDASGEHAREQFARWLRGQTATPRVMVDQTLGAMVAGSGYALDHAEQIRAHVPPVAIDGYLVALAYEALMEGDSETLVSAITSMLNHMQPAD